MEKTIVSRNQLVNQLLHIGHGDLSVYVDIGLRSVSEEPELFAHLIAWNQINGEVRDSKVAFPAIALRGEFDAEYTENAIAHMLSLDPRNLVRSIEFSRKLNLDGYQVKRGSGAMLKNGVERYLHVRENNKGWWSRTVVQHRKSMKTLYTTFHIKPAPFAQSILFKRIKPNGSVFEAIANLKNMNPDVAAGTILNFKIPFTIATGALGGIKGKSDILLALIEQMSGSELLNNTNMLKKSGVFDNPVLKSAYESALEKSKKDKKVSMFKASKAAEVIGDKKIAKKVQSFQEAKLDQAQKIKGDWLILGDRSGSMDTAINVARNAAATIAKMVEGNVYLVFFNTDPIRYDVTGKSLEEIKQMTRSIRANGGTAVGCGLELLRESNIIVNGIVICSDGGDNRHPLFHEAYARYSKTMGIEPTVYHFWVPGETDRLRMYAEQIGLKIEWYDMRQVDYYSMPNLIKTLRSNRYTLIDEIMQVPLLTINKVLNQQREG